MQTSRSSFSKRASALLMVLWVIALLSFLVITSLMVSMQDVETVTSRKLVFRTRQLAEMGLAIASHPMVKENDPLLRQQFPDGGSFEALISSEEARLNLNRLLTDERRGILERLFNGWGMPLVEAQALVDSLMDWSDLDDLKRLKGAEKQDYRDAGFPDRPFNRPFRTLDEVSLVLGMDVLSELKPDWQDVFTLRGDGKLDMNEASPELIALLAEAPLHLAQTLVAQRLGRDGLPHTLDDVPIENLQEGLTLLGLTGDRAETIGGLFTLKGSTLRIESTGRLGDYARSVHVVMNKSGTTPEILEWKERAEN